MRLFSVLRLNLEQGHTGNPLHYHNFMLTPCQCWASYSKIVTSYSISYFSQKVTKVVTELQILKVTSYFGK